MRNQDERHPCWRSACTGVLVGDHWDGAQVCPVCGEPRNAGIDPKDLKAPAERLGYEAERATFGEDHWVARSGKTLTRHYPDNYWVTGPDHEHLPGWEEVEEYATVEKAKEDLRCDVLSWKKESTCSMCGREDELV